MQPQAMTNSWHRQTAHASKDESTARQQQKHTTSYLGTVKLQKISHVTSVTLVL